MLNTQRSYTVLHKVGELEKKTQREKNCSSDYLQGVFINNGAFIEQIVNVLPPQVFGVECFDVGGFRLHFSLHLFTSYVA